MEGQGARKLFLVGICFFHDPCEFQNLILGPGCTRTNILNKFSRSSSTLILNLNHFHYESPSNGIRHLGFSEVSCGHVLSPQYVLLAKGTFECTIYNVASKLSKMADVDGEFVTVLLQINLTIRTDLFELYFIAQYIKVG